LFHKRKRKSFIIFSLFLGFGPLAQPAPPLAPAGPSGCCPSFSFGPAKWPAHPSSWAGPQTKPQHALPPSLAADVRSPPSSAADAWARHPAVSYLPPQLEEPSSFATAAGDRAICSFPSFWTRFPSHIKPAAPPKIYFHLAPQKTSSHNPRTLARRSSSGFSSPTTHCRISHVAELRCTVGTFPAPSFSFVWLSGDP
jgi:hypothetical protein